MQIKTLRDATEITLRHQTHRGTNQELWLSVRQTELGPLVNLAATGDISPATARRLGRLLLVAADVADELSPKDQA